MTRLRPLALVLLVGAASAAKAAEPTYGSIIAEAKAFVKTSCAAAKPTCGKVETLHAGYLTALQDADACAETACSVAKVHAIINRDRALDEAEHALPPKARASGSKRPLLRLSLLVMGRAGAALTLADPKAEGPPYSNPDVEAPKMVELVCAKFSGLCGDARGILREADDLNSDAAACEKKPCPFSEQEALAIAAERNTDDYVVLSGKVDTHTLPIFVKICEARVRIAKVLARASAAKVAELESGERSLLAGVSALEKDPAGAGRTQIDALNARGAELVALYRDASISSDRTAALLTGEPQDGRLREKVNASAARLASARARLAALKAARGFGDRAETDGVAAGSSRPARPAAGPAKLGLTLTGGTRPDRALRPVLLDRRAIPAPPPSDPSAPAIIPGDPGYLDLLRNLRSKDPLIKVDARRRLGLTKTLGDPAGRAGLVHQQKSPDTCAIVAQQGILMAHGLLPKGDPVKIEAQLAAEAADRGFYRHGTPDAYTANLLVERGLIVTKQNDASLKTLDAAVRRGGMIIANLDARHLNGTKAPQVLGHAILITGAEVGRLDGRTLGYYINDSDPGGRWMNRFVPIETFRKAWDAHTRSFAEVH